MVRLAIERPSSTDRPGRVEDYDLHWVDTDPRLHSFGYR